MHLLIQQADSLEVKADKIADKSLKEYENEAIPRVNKSYPLHTQTWSPNYHIRGHHNLPREQAGTCIDKQPQLLGHFVAGAVIKVEVIAFMTEASTILQPRSGHGSQVGYKFLPGRFYARACPKYEPQDSPSFEPNNQMEPLTKY